MVIRVNKTAVIVGGLHQMVVLIITLAQFVAIGIVKIGYFEIVFRGGYIF